MKTLETIAGKMYVVMSPNGGTVTSADGLISEVVEAGKQKVIVGTGAALELNDDAGAIIATFNAAPTLGGNGGGGGNISFDTTPTSGSGNAVTSGGLYNLLFDKKVRLGYNSSASGEAVVIGQSAVSSAAGSVALGRSAEGGQQSVAVGYNANSNMTNHGIAVGYGAYVKGANYAMAIGCNTNVSKPSGQAFGYSAKLKNKGCTLIGTWSDENRTVQTLFYIIAAGSELATQYEGGEACLGYVVKESSGNVIACGTRKLSELLTSNTAFAPAVMDLDADPAMPFLPDGIMEPVTFKD